MKFGFVFNLFIHGLNILICIIFTAKLRQSAATAKHAKMEELIRTSEQKAAQVQAQCEQ